MQAASTVEERESLQAMIHAPEEKPQITTAVGPSATPRPAATANLRPYKRRKISREEAAATADLDERFQAEMRRGR